MSGSRGDGWGFRVDFRLGMAWVWGRVEGHPQLLKSRSNTLKQPLKTQSPPKTLSSKPGNPEPKIHVRAAECCSGGVRRGGGGGSAGRGHEGREERA